MKKILAMILCLMFTLSAFANTSEADVWATLTGTYIDGNLEDDFRNIDIVGDDSGPISITAGWDESPAVIAANFLAEQGIIVDHKDNTELYELDNDIQRQAVMKIVMKLSGKKIIDACRGEFGDVDVNDWPCKYIEAGLDAGYIAANDNFRPFDNITMTEAMKLVLKAKGIQKVQTTDNWQEDYMMTAYEYGIIDKKYYNYNDNATRGWIFQIATATIQKEEEIIEKGGIISDEAL